MVPVSLSPTWIKAENEIRILSNELGVTVTSLKLVVSVEEPIPSVEMASEM